MLWFTLAFLTAAFSAIEAAYIKKNFPELRPFEMAMYPAAYSIPFFLGLLLCLDTPDLSPQYWQTFCILLPLNILGTLLYFRGLNLAPLSLTMPYIAFTPAFVLITGYVILGEKANIWGGAGVVLIAAGSYLLNAETRRTGGWLAPIRAIVSQPGSQAMLGAAIAFSVAGALGKKGIVESDPLFFSATFFLAQGVVVTVFLPLLGLARLSVLRTTPLKGVFIGALLLVHIMCHCYAISLTKAAYMIAIKRLNAVFAVLLGGLWLKESGMATRLAGAAFMFLGAAVIGLLGQ